MTIYNQLGANRFSAMTGSKNFVAFEDKENRKGLAFKLSRNQSKAGYCAINYDSGKDLYVMVFYKITRSGDIEIIRQYDEVYFDMLEYIFTEVTGLYTRLF